jgi:RecB family exonuclease
MFVVTEADAAAIRANFDEQGELSAAIELRRRFPGIADDSEALARVRTIGDRKKSPLPVMPRRNTERARPLPDRR